MPFSAETVARAFIGFCNEHGDLITNLKLQKLLYYAQGWNLALHGEPLFTDRIEAWIHGPVCPAVYHEYKRFGHKPIDVDVDSATAPEPLMKHVQDVWEAYGELSAFDLERMSHQEPAWKEARQGLAPDVPSENPLSLATMKTFFLSELRRG